MASRSLALFACSAAAALALAAPALAGAVPIAAPAEATPPPLYSAKQIIVVWEEGASRGEKAAARSNAEVDTVSTLGDPNFQLVEVQPGQSAAEAIAELHGEDAVAVAERSSFLYPTSVPDDTLFPEQWALQNTGAGISNFSGAVAGDDINAPLAWDLTVGDPKTIVADIDSGYRFGGPDLGPAAWTNTKEIPGNGIDDDKNGFVDDVHGFDFVGTDADKEALDADPTDDNLVSGGHGVHTAGIIGAAGNNAAGITGVAQNVSIMPLRVCANSVKAGNKLACPTPAIIAAINYAGANGARVANISLTTTSASSGMLKALGANPQTLFVIAAGNDVADNDSVPHYPCNYQPAKESGVTGAIDNVVCVAATDQADNLASFSDWGKTSVDLGAPGTEILSTYPIEDLLAEGPEFANFATRWEPGPEGGFGRVKEPPLTSFGITDSPEEPTPAANSTRVSELKTAITVPSGYGNCQLTGRRSVALGATGKFTQQFIINGGSEILSSFPTNTPGTTMRPFETSAISGLAGSTVKIRFRYEAGSSPGPNNGVWLDDLAFSCYQPTNAAPSYAFKEGTSMAAPQVSGTAALLFSLQPTASVATVRSALLAGVDADPSLAGKTVTGGRLDARKALDALDITPPGKPELTGTTPASPAEASNPRIVGTEPDPTSMVRIFTGAGCSPGKQVAAGTPAELASPGIAVTVAHETTAEFSANAIDPALNVSLCSAPIKYQQKDDKEAPLAPQLTTTSPASPGLSGTPRILGVAESKSTVRLYTNETCGGTAVATASAEALLAPGIPVSVPSSTTVTFWATATDAPGNISPCSGPISYTNSSLIEPIIDPTQNPPPPSSSCTVPKVAGKTLAKAKTALTNSLCKTGKVTKPRTKPRTKPGQKLGPLVVKSSSPAAGAVASSGVVALKLGPKPKARRR